MTRLLNTRMDGFQAIFLRRPSDKINALVLAANVAESMTIPDGYRYVLFSATDPFWVRAGAAAAKPSADVTAGSASEYMPAAYELLDAAGAAVTTLSILSETAGCVVTGAFYK